MEKTVGFIGLGVLGSAIVPNLIESGTPVLGYDINQDILNELGGQGMRIGSSPKDIADQTDIVFLCLPTVDSLQEVVNGDKGLIHSQANNQIIIEMSTFPVDAKEEAKMFLDGIGMTMLDCPVSGNRIHASKRQLTLFGSGDKESYDKVEPIFKGFANDTYYVGEFGCGLKMKFVGNILNLVHNSVAAEVMVLGMKSGLDPKLIHEVLSGSASSSRMFDVRGKMMAENNYRHEGMNFSIPMKDSRIISDHAAKHLAPIPIYQAALQPYYAAVSQGHYDEDQSAVCAALEYAANCVRKT
ncbi:NAD(P)-dependent oxidoreductase [Pseudomonadota bacterium]